VKRAPNPQLLQVSCFLDSSRVACVVPLLLNNADINKMCCWEVNRTLTLVFSAVRRILWCAPCTARPTSARYGATHPLPTQRSCSQPVRDPPPQPEQTKPTLWLTYVRKNNWLRQNVVLTEGFLSALHMLQTIQDVHNSFLFAHESHDAYYDSHMQTHCAAHSSTATLRIHPRVPITTEGQASSAADDGTVRRVHLFPYLNTLFRRIPSVLLFRVLLSSVLRAAVHSALHVHQYCILQVVWVVRLTKFACWCGIERCKD
jgi:hypothetical protein